MVEIALGILCFVFIIFLIAFSFMVITGLLILMLNVSVRIYDNCIKNWLDEHIGEVDNSL